MKNTKKQPYKDTPFSVSLREVFSKKEWGAKSKCAKAIGKSVGYLSELSSGKKQGTEGVRREIAAFLGYTYESMLELGNALISGDDDKQTAFKESMSKDIGIGCGVEVTGGKSIPVISWVQAGEWNDIADAFQPGDADEFVLVCRNVSKNTFALRISGNSMAPEFLPGDIIVVDPAVQPETGKFVVAKTENGNGENGEATFKKFERDGNKVFLVPLNDKFEVMDMTGIEFRIVGCVVQKSKEYW